MTLIELMIGLCLSTLLFSIISVIYLAAVHNQSVQTALMRTEENSRIAIQILNTDLRLAGFTGCAKLNNNIMPDPPYSFTMQNRLFLFKNDDQLSGTDAVTVQHASIFFVNLIEKMPDTHSLQTTSQLLFKSGDIVLLTDCQSADIFIVKTISKQDNTQFIETDHLLQKQYDKNAELHFFEKNSYFLAKTTRVDEAQQPVYALYKSDIQQKKTELVEGMNDSKIIYTLLEDGKFIEKTSNNVIDWSKVAGISIAFIFSSMNSIPLQKKEFTYVAIRE